MSPMDSVDTKIRFLFLTRTLGIGGRERQLVTLAKGLDKTRFDVTVVTFYDGGEFGHELKCEPGVQVLSLGKKGRWDLGAFTYRLMAVVRRVRPHIIHGYGMVANELSWLMGRLYRARVVWGVRNLAPEIATRDRLLRILNKFRFRQCLSSKVDLIIVNSHAGFRSLVSRGYLDNKMLVIPNGIDTEYFSPAEKSEKEAMRQQWGLLLDHLVIGLAARIHPNKGHRTFLYAAALLKRSHPDVWYVCVGSGSDAYMADLRTMSQELGIADRIFWAGWEKNMPAVYNAFDIATTTSEEREGFSNAVAEAMACSVPCVVTDIGDSAFIVGDTGIVVSAKDPVSLARAWERLLSMSEAERRDLGHRARRRIEENFPISLLVRRTQEEFKNLVR